VKLETEVDDEKIDRLLRALKDIGISMSREEFMEFLKKMLTTSNNKSIDLFYETIIAIKLGATNMDEVLKKVSEAGKLFGLTLGGNEDGC